MIDLVDLSIAEASTALRRGEVSSSQLTEATLQRIAETEPSIHAYVYIYEEEAPRIASERDRELSAGRWRGPLHGVPIAIKDLLYTTDAPTAAGAEALAGTMYPHDAAIVERLREAGAVIIGKTVTHELAYGVNTPPTRNPWGSDHYPGGSSAGSGAAVAARSAYGAIGTDTGGSIREPASLNGLVGLKPTFGCISRYGIVPLSPSLDHAGPMTRTVQDCALLLEAIAGFDPRDSGSIDVSVPAFVAGIDTGARGKRVGVERDFFFGPRIRPEVKDAVNDVLEELREAGAEIIEVSMPELNVMSPVGLTWPRPAPFTGNSCASAATNSIPTPASCSNWENWFLAPITCRLFVPEQCCKISFAGSMTPMASMHYLRQLCLLPPYLWMPWECRTTQARIH